MKHSGLLIDGVPPSVEDLDWLLASRALAFGEGVFTSLRVWQGKPVFWSGHLKRLQTSLKDLGAALPPDWWVALSAEVLLVAQQLQAGRLKIMLLAGPGGQGYRASPSSIRWHRVIHPLVWQPPVEPYQGIRAWWMQTQDERPLSRHKHLNCLPQVLLSQRCPSDYSEAVLFDERGFLTEGLSRNLFWYAQGQWFTPALHKGVLAGVMRFQVIEACSQVSEQVQACLADLQQAEEVFLCNSVQGIWPLLGLDDASGALADWALGPQTLVLMQRLHPQMGLPAGDEG